MQLLYTTTATALLAATGALAAGTPRDQGVSTTAFNAMVRYATFCSAANHVPCGHVPFNASVVAYINETTTDTQATLFRDDAKKELILAFQGSVSFVDFLTDANFILQTDYRAGNGLSAGCDGCKVHAGFYKAWKATAPLVKGNLTQAQNKYSGYSITITGHSLGGALASLAFAEFSAAGTTISRAYTLGQPRTGNAAYAAYVDSLSGASGSTVGTLRRITHANDPVPLIPPTFSGYSHHSTEFWQQDDANHNTSAALTSRCYGDEPQDCIQSSTTIDPNAHLHYSNVEISSTSPACN